MSATNLTAVLQSHMRVARHRRRLPDGRPGLEQALPADGHGSFQQEVHQPPRHPWDVKQDRINVPAGTEQVPRDERLPAVEDTFLQGHIFYTKIN